MSWREIDFNGLQVTRKALEAANVSADKAQVTAGQEAAGRLLYRVSRAVELDQGLKQGEGLALLDKKAEHARAAGDRSLGGVVDATGGDSSYVNECVKILERIDAVRAKVFEREKPAVADLPVDPMTGMVMLTQATPLGTRERVDRATCDPAVALTDPAEQERRLARARHVEPKKWRGDEARARFMSEDRQHLEEGLDMVATAERPYQLAAAHRHAEEQAKQVSAGLYAQLAQCAHKRGELRELSKRIDPALPKSARDAAQRAIDHDMFFGGLTEPLNLLDQVEAQVRLLDAPKTTKARKKAKKLTAVPSWEQVQTRMRELSRPQTEFDKTLREMVKGKEPKAEPITLSTVTAADKPAPTPVPTDAPKEVHWAVGRANQAVDQSAQVDAQVRDRMRMLGAPESSYATILAQILKED